MELDFNTKTLFDCLGLTAGENEIDVEIFPDSSESAIKKIVGDYVKECDRLFWKNANSENPTHINLFDFLKKRFVSFDEFLEVFSLPLQFEYLEYKEKEPIKDSYFFSNKLQKNIQNTQEVTRKEKPNYYYIDYLPSYFLNIFKILNEYDFIKFKKNYTPDIQGYMKLLEESQSEKLKSFFFKETRPFNIPFSQREKHCYITGGTGSGKSELLKLLIYKDLKSIAEGKARNIVLIDPHGDLAQAFYSMDLSDRIKSNFIYFDPFFSPNRTILPVERGSRP